MSSLFERERLSQVVIQKSMREQILTYSRTSPDVEVCGLVGGLGELANSFYPVKNVALDPTSNFFMDPAEQIDAMRAMQRRGEQILAIFHSHPHSAAEPSATDLALAAYPGVAYLIAQPENFGSDKNTNALKCYLYQDSQFTPLDLVVVDN